MTTKQTTSSDQWSKVKLLFFRLVVPLWCIFSTSLLVASENTANPVSNAGNKSTIVVSNKVPPGFEDLAGPQTNQVDVFFQNRLLLSTIATYDFETLRFHNPQLVAEQIEDLIDPDAILKIIRNPLAINADLLCLSQTANEDCGLLEPNIAGIIFDEGRFRVDLFINPLQLETKAIYSTKFLPPAEDKLSTIHVLNLNLSGTDEFEDRFNMQANSMLAFGDSRVNVQSNFTDNEDFVIDEFSVQKDNPGWEAEAGVFNTESNASNFFSEQDVLGARVKTSTNTRTDLEYASGTAIFIFLSQRSRVEVFKDDRLIDAKFYEAGNRQLDTSRFPDGAYNISVRIREENGRERREEYFFVRNASLPPIGEPQYYVEAGKINEVQQDSTLPETTDNYIIHAGGSIRVKENLAVEAEVANSNDESMLQLGLTHLIAGLESHLNIMTTTESDWGVSVRESWYTEKFAISVDLRHISEGDENDDLDRFDFVNATRTQASASLTHKFLGGRAFWRYRHNDRSDAIKSETYSVRYRRQIFRNHRYQLDWDFEANKDSDDYLIGANLNFRFRKGQNEIIFSPGLQTRKSDNERDDDVVGNIAWQHTERNPVLGRLQSRVFHTRESDFSTTGINVTSESRYGYNEIEIDQTRDEDTDNNILGYSMRSQFNLASDFKTVSVGGSRYSRSAVIVDLTGQPKGAKFEVFVDRQSAGFAEVGARTIIPLPAYDTYDIRLESRADTFLSFDENPRQVTLYPGNVNAMTWQVDRVLIFIGRALDLNGDAIQYARIENAGSFAGTDDRGWFQVETGQMDALILSKKDGTRCKLSLGEYNADQDVHVLNDLLCVPISDSQPESEPTPVQASAQLH